MERGLGIALQAMLEKKAVMSRKWGRLVGFLYVAPVFGFSRGMMGYSGSLLCVTREVSFPACGEGSASLLWRHGRGIGHQETLPRHAPRHAPRRRRSGHHSNGIAGAECCLFSNECQEIRPGGCQAHLPGVGGRERERRVDRRARSSWVKPLIKDKGFWPPLANWELP